MIVIDHKDYSNNVKFFGTSNIKKELFIICLYEQIKNSPSEGKNSILENDKQPKKLITRAISPTRWHSNPTANSDSIEFNIAKKDSLLAVLLTNITEFLSI